MRKNRDKMLIKQKKIQKVFHREIVLSKKACPNNPNGLFLWKIQGDGKRNDNNNQTTGRLPREVC